MRRIDELTFLDLYTKGVGSLPVSTLLNPDSWFLPSVLTIGGDGVLIDMQEPHYAFLCFELVLHRLESDVSSGM